MHTTRFWDSKRAERRAAKRATCPPSSAVGPRSVLLLKRARTCKRERTASNARSTTAVFD